MDTHGWAWRAWGTFIAFQAWGALQEGEQSYLGAGKLGIVHCREPAACTHNGAGQASLSRESSQPGGPVLPGEAGRAWVPLQGQGRDMSTGTFHGGQHIPSASRTFIFILNHPMES